MKLANIYKLLVMVNYEGNGHLSIIDGKLGKATKEEIELIAAGCCEGGAPPYIYKRLGLTEGEVRTLEELLDAGF